MGIFKHRIQSGDRVKIKTSIYLGIKEGTLGTIRDCIDDSSYMVSPDLYLGEKPTCDSILKQGLFFNQNEIRKVRG